MTGGRSSTGSAFAAIKCPPLGSNRGLTPPSYREFFYLIMEFTGLLSNGKSISFPAMRGKAPPHGPEVSK